MEVVAYLSDITILPTASLFPRKAQFSRPLSGDKFEVELHRGYRTSFRRGTRFVAELGQTPKLQHQLELKKVHVQEFQDHSHPTHPHTSHTPPHITHSHSLPPSDGDNRWIQGDLFPCSPGQYAGRSVPSGTRGVPRAQQDKAHVQIASGAGCAVQPLVP